MEENRDDILLLNLIRVGDQLAFKHLFETYFTSLCRFMYVYINEKPVVEELALDIFMYVWENRETLRIRISFKAYLFQAARNKCLNELRKEKHIISLDELATDIADTGIMSLESDELYRFVEEAVCALPEKCRTVFQLSRNENLSNQEIASRLNISVKTVEGQITKALKRIKVFLGDSYYYLW
ncbi:MAG: RNA polymerase sigma-70 factor [Candidatus Symbiothrix sp.]|jgi:RNA polymerase sigma-70 factor (ECF subfamily)|nr:RNA polymerase sigma-70 factor [Candidatus Symbiothrix sp.]